MKKILFPALMSFSLISCQDTGNRVEGEVKKGVYPVPVSFTLNLPFSSASSSDYVSSDSQNTELVSGALRLKAAEQVDSSAAHFNNVNMTGIQWDGTQLRLNTSTNTSDLSPSWTPKYSSLIGYWKMNEASGLTTLVNSITTAPTSDISNFANSPTLGVAGKLDKAVTLTGGAQARTTANITLGNDITFSMWVNLNSSSQIQTILATAPQAQQSAGFKIGVNEWNTSNRRVIFENGTGAVGTVAKTSVNAFAFGTWNHIAVVVDKSTLKAKIYVNAQEMTEANTINNFSDTKPLYLGTMTDGSFPMSGNVDEVAIWNTQLTAAEIHAIYTRQAAKISGTYTSRIFQAFDTTSTWNSVSGTTTGPFHKELPAPSEAETSATYSSLTANISQDIVGLWHLNEAAGTSSANSVLDASGFNRDGSPTSVTFGDLGAFSRAATFNGTSSQIAVPYSSSLSPTKVTAAAWFKLTSTSANQRIISNLNGGGYEISLNAGGTCTASQLCFLVYVNGTAYSVRSPSSNLRANQWYHVVGVYDGADVKMYLNGQSVGTPVSVSGAISYANANPLCIGSSPTLTTCTGGQYYSGSVDEVTLWNAGLDANQVLSLYRRGANRVLYQVRSCVAADCSDQEALTTTGMGWSGYDGTFLTYASEIQNNSSVSTGVPSGTVQGSGPLMTIPSLANSKYVQYRVVLQSDETNGLCSYGNCSPEIKSIGVGPDHYVAGEYSITSTAGIGSSYRSLTPNTFVVADSCTPGTRFALSGDGTKFYYWNGATWDISNNYGTGSSATEISSHLESFPLSRGVLYFRMYLKTDGLNQCQINSVSISGTRL